MRIVNLDHHNTMPGGCVGQPTDRACVLSETETETNPVTGKQQSKQVFIGTLSGAHSFVAENDYQGCGHESVLTADGHGLIASIAATPSSSLRARREYD